MTAPDEGSAADGALLTPELRRLVGVAWPAETLEVDRSSIRMFARAVGYEDPVFYDEAVARERGFERLPAPPGFLGVRRYRPGQPEVGPPIRGLHPELTRSLNGGTTFRLLRPVMAGDELEAATTIVDIVERAGRLGPMLIFTRETNYHRGDELVAVMEQTVINY